MRFDSESQANCNGNRVTNVQKLDILSLGLDELTQRVQALGEPKYRAVQVYRWLHEKTVSSFDEMTNISAQFRTKLDDIFYINSLNIAKKLVSSIDNTIKYLYELGDGHHVETVLMRYKHGNSLCISTQVGCKMGCGFCASAIAGFVRNLSASEMLSQIYETERDTGERLSTIVLMGIGEPLDNYDNTVAFLDILSSPEGRNMSLRHVSVSTCGLADKIYDLAQRKYGVTLSVSLHAPTDEQRSGIMPVNRRFSIAELMEACRFYTDKTGRRISFEYALIRGVNDTKECAQGLIGLLKGMLCHVNLIPVNEVAERKDRYRAGTAQSVAAFQKMLEQGGLNVTVRRTLGVDINAACGQLRREQTLQGL